MVWKTHTKKLCRFRGAQRRADDLDATDPQLKLRTCDGAEPQRVALRGTPANAKDTTLCLGHEAGTANRNRLTVETCNSGDTSQRWQSWSKQ